MKAGSQGGDPWVAPRARVVSAEPTGGAVGGGARGASLSSGMQPWWWTPAGWQEPQDLGALLLLLLLQLLSPPQLAGEGTAASLGSPAARPPAASHPLSPCRLLTCRRGANGDILQLLELLGLPRHPRPHGRNSPSIADHFQRQIRGAAAQ